MSSHVYARRYARFGQFGVISSVPVHSACAALYQQQWAIACFRALHKAPRVQLRLHHDRTRFCQRRYWYNRGRVGLRRLHRTWENVEIERRSLRCQSEQWTCAIAEGLGARTGWTFWEYPWRPTLAPNLSCLCLSCPVEHREMSSRAKGRTPISLVFLKAWRSNPGNELPFHFAPASETQGRL